MNTPQTPAADEPAQPDLAIRTMVYGENPHPPGGISILLSVKSNVAAPNTKIKIALPRGAILLNGVNTWSGDLAAGQTIYLNLLVVIKSLSRAGRLRVDGSFPLPDGAKVARTHTLFARQVADGRIEVSSQPFSK